MLTQAPKSRWRPLRRVAAPKYAFSGPVSLYQFSAITLSKSESQSLSASAFLSLAKLPETSTKFVSRVRAGLCVLLRINSKSDNNLRCEESTSAVPGNIQGFLSLVCVGSGFIDSSITRLCFIAASRIPFEIRPPTNQPTGDAHTRIT